MEEHENETSEWDKVVPIIREKNSISAYLCDGIAMPGSYNEICHELRNATSADTITIYINTPGGVLDSAVMLIDAIENSDAHTIAHLSGTVASAGTMIALACDEIILSKHLSFMIHNYSGGGSGKGHELKARQEFADASLEKAFKTFYSGFLTDSEIQEVIDGKDLWMDEEEVSRRWLNRLAYLNPDLSKE